MICKRATYTIKEGAEARVEKLIEGFMAGVREHDKDLIFYEVFRNDGSRTYEHLMCFENEETQERHRRSAHTEAFVNEMFPLCSDGPTFEDVHRVDGGVC